MKKEKKEIKRIKDYTTMPAVVFILTHLRMQSFF